METPRRRVIAVSGGTQVSGADQRQVWDNKVGSSGVMGVQV